MEFPQTAPHQAHSEMAPVGGLGAVQKVNISGKAHPSADGLVARAHREATDRGYYIVGTNMNVVQLPSQDNGQTTIVLATVHLREDHSGETHSYQDLGDANPNNCGNGPTSNVALAAPRMAATRAMSRALALALNIADAVAEEIAQGGSGQQAVQNQANGQGGYTPAATGAPAGGAGDPLAALKAQFPGAPDWKFKIRGGNNKDQYITSAAVTIDDLNYWLGRGFFTKNAQTQQYDVPDNVSAQIYQAEIARRQGGGGVAAPPAGQQAAPPPNYTPPAQQNTAPTAGAPAAGGAFKVQGTMVPDLLALAKAQGKTWMDVKAESLSSFGVPEPKDITTLDEWNMLRMAFGGAAI